MYLKSHVSAHSFGSNKVSLYGLPIYHYIGRAHLDYRTSRPDLHRKGLQIRGKRFG